MTVQIQKVGSYLQPWHFCLIKCLCKRLSPRDAILQHTHHIIAPPTLDTGELPSEITTGTIKRKAPAWEVVAPAKKSRGEGGVAGEFRARVRRPQRSHMARLEYP
jgi:hypothetical protein